MKKSIFLNLSQKSIVIRYIALFLSLIILYTLSLVFTSTYPEKIDKYSKYHITYSADRLSENESDWFFFFTKNLSSKTDNYADSLMLHITYCNDILPPFKAAFAGAMYGDTYASSQLSALVATTRGEPKDELVYYSRYWHGYRVWLKPLTIFFDYMQIRLFNMYVFYLLFLLCCIYLYKKVNLRLSLALAITIIMLNIVLIPMNLMYTCVFIISFVGCIAAIKIQSVSPKNLGLLFFTIGSTTMFFDFYSYPSLSLGLPLVCILSISLKDSSSLKSILRLSLVCITAWLLGYLLTWLANLSLSALILGGEDAKTTIDVLKYRLARGNSSISFFDSIWQFSRQGFRAIKVSLSELLIAPHGAILGFISSMWIVLFIFFREKSIKYKKLLGFLPIFSFPIIWYSVASKPAIQHVYFQYRGIGLWVMIVLSIMFITIDFDKINSTFKKAFSSKKDR